MIELPSANAQLDASGVLKKYGNSILRCAYSYVHNMPDAEDVLQDTLIQMIRTKPVFESDEHEKAWLLRVAINISKNKLKSAALHGTDELSDAQPCEEDENLSFVWDAVSSLPEKYREVIHLFYHEGYTTSEMASLLGKKEVTVRSLLHRGRSILKDILKGEYDFGD